MMMGDMMMQLPRKKAANKIFVGGLHWETTDEKLRKHFMLFGEVIDAVVMKDPISRRSRGFGFITFADAAAVDRVLSQDNHILDSRRVEAKRAVPRSETLIKDNPPTPPMRPLALNAGSSLPGLLGSGGGLPSHHHGAGTTASLIGMGGGDYGGGGGGIVQPPPLPLPPSYHHVQQQQQGPPSMQSQLGGMGGMGGMGGGGGMSSSSHLLATNKIFVGGLHYETKDAEFRQYFENFGRVVSAEVMFNRETHKSRGFGFVVFDDENAVENVLSVPQHSIDGKMVEVKRAIPRNQVASPIMGGSSGGSRGLSPSFGMGGGMGSSNHKGGGGGGGGGYPPSLSLDKGMMGGLSRQQQQAGISYAQVLRGRAAAAAAGGGYSHHHQAQQQQQIIHQGLDLAALTESMGDVSLRQKQETLAALSAQLGGGGGGGGGSGLPPSGGASNAASWATIEQLLESMDGRGGGGGGGGGGYPPQQPQQQHNIQLTPQQLAFLQAQAQAQAFHQHQQQQQAQQQQQQLPPGLNPSGDPYHHQQAPPQQLHSYHAAQQPPSPGGDASRYQFAGSEEQQQQRQQLWQDQQQHAQGQAQAPQAPSDRTTPPPHPPGSSDSDGTGRRTLSWEAILYPNSSSSSTTGPSPQQRQPQQEGPGSSGVSGADSFSSVSSHY